MSNNVGGDNVFSMDSENDSEIPVNQNDSKNGVNSNNNWDSSIPSVENVANGNDNNMGAHTADDARPVDEAAGIAEPAFTSDDSVSTSVDTGGNNESSNGGKGLTKLFCGIGAIIVVVAIILCCIIFWPSGGQKNGAQSGESFISVDADSSENAGLEAKQARIDAENPPGFRRAVSPARKDAVAKEFNKPYVKDLDDSVNPLKASPLGVYPYDVRVPEEWKDSFDGEDGSGVWETMIAGSLNDLTTLWNNPIFNGPAFDGDVQGKMKAIYDVTQRDIFLNRLAPLFGIEWGSNKASSKDNAKLDDYQYFYSLVPVLDADGKVPGTNFKPKSNVWDSTLGSIKVLDNDNPKGAVWSNNPRISVIRITHYDNNSVVSMQDITYFVNNVNGTWKIIQTEYSPVELFNSDGSPYAG